MAGDLGTIVVREFENSVTATDVNTPGSWDASVNQTFTYAFGGWPIRLPSDRSLWGSVSGVVTDASDNPVARTVRVINRASGEMIAETVSDPTTGEYSVLSPLVGEVQAIALDDSAGVLENDLILRTIVV